MTQVKIYGEQLGKSRMKPIGEKSQIVRICSSSRDQQTKCRVWPRRHGIAANSSALSATTRTGDQLLYGTCHSFAIALRRAELSRVVSCPAASAALLSSRQFVRTRLLRRALCWLGARALASQKTFGLRALQRDSWSRSALPVRHNWTRANFSSMTTRLYHSNADMCTSNSLGGALTRHLLVSCVRHKLHQLHLDIPHASLQPPRQKENQLDGNGNCDRQAHSELVLVEQHRELRSTLRALCHEFEQAYEDRFESLTSALDVEPGHLHSLFHTQVEELFSGGQINWGRIVALFVLTSHLCVLSVQRNRLHQVPLLLEWTCAWIDSHLNDWIQTNGGWVGSKHIVSIHVAVCVYIWLMIS